MHDIIMRERKLLASCLREHWRMSLAYGLTIMYYVRIVHDARPVYLSSFGTAIPEWMPNIFFRAVIGFICLIGFNHITGLGLKKWFCRLCVAAGTAGSAMVIVCMENPAYPSWPVILGALLSSISTFFLACALLGTASRIGVVQNLRCIIIAAVAAIFIIPVIVLLPGIDITLASPVFPIIVFELIAHDPKTVWRTRHVAKTSTDKLFVPALFLLTGLFDGIIFGLYMAIGGPVSSNAVLFMIAASAFSSFALFYPIILSNFTYNHILFKIAFPLGALGFILVLPLGENSIVAGLVFLTSFVMRYITVYTLNIYHVTRYDLPVVWVGSYADSARNIGQLIGYAIPAFILPVHGITLASTDIAVIGAFFCLIVSVYLQKETDDKAGWSHSKLDEDKPRSMVEEACKLIATENALSKREGEVLVCLARGNSQKSTAEKLYISVDTVKTHTNSIYRKLGVHSKQELIDYVHKLSETMR